MHKNGNTQVKLRDVDYIKSRKQVAIEKYTTYLVEFTIDMWKINNNFRKIMLSCFQIFSCAVIGWNVEVTILIEIDIFGSLRM